MVRISDNNDENGEEKEQCDVCGQIFKWKGSLYLHKKLHIGKMVLIQLIKRIGLWWEIVLCLFILMLNIRYTEDDELRRPFKCDQCGKKYTKVHHLERHAALHLREFIYRIDLVVWTINVVSLSNSSSFFSICFYFEKS